MAAATINHSSDTFHRVNTAKLTTEILAVTRSTGARSARTSAAPAIAPVAAAETVEDRRVLVRESSSSMVRPATDVLKEEPRLDVAWVSV
jgi:hypothetical protein